MKGNEYSRPTLNPYDTESLIDIYRLIFPYFVSLWGVCFPQNLQYFLNSNLCVVVFLFFVFE